MKFAAIATALITIACWAADPPAEKPKPRYQYEAEGILIPGASADEAKVTSFGVDSIRAAIKYLDDGAHYWVREKSCVACHTSGVYLVERPHLTALLGPPSAEVRADFEKSIPEKPSSPIKTVWRSSGLASWDAHVSGRLSTATDASLRQTLALMSEDGSLKTITQVEIPYITTDFELTVQAARAIATAPGWQEQIQDDETKERVERLKRFLKEHEPISDFERALKLQLSTLMPGLVAAAEVEAAQAMLWQKQLPDGGWSLRRMSDLMKWHVKMDPKVVTMIESEPDAAAPESDAYMTAWAIVLLRESGVPADEPRIRKGIDWLKRNQRISGRWWMKSLYRDTYHYSTYISTAQALRALALCGEVPKLVE
jgi:squalene-hopene/tetraprenyl-beta-curcumene cyclase